MLDGAIVLTWVPLCEVNVSSLKIRAAFGMHVYVHVTCSHGNACMMSNLILGLRYFPFSAKIVDFFLLWSDGGAHGMMQYCDAPLYFIGLLCIEMIPCCWSSCVILQCDYCFL